MVSWLINLKDASYKGVPFKVDLADVNIGRDVEVRTTPVSDLIDKNTGEPIAGGFNPWVRDRGELPREMTVTAHFSGLNYQTDRNAFIQAVEEGGGGLLQLPSYEPINVIATKASVQYNNKQGGYETIKVAFVKYDTQLQPTSTLNTQNATTDGVNASQQTFIDSFSTKLSSGAQWVADASTNLTQKLSTDLLDTLGLGAAGDALDTVKASALTLSQNATTLIYTPTTLANQINDLVEQLTFAFQQPIDAFRAQKQLFETYGTGLPETNDNTPTEEDAQDNQISFTQIVQNSAVSQMGNASALIDYVSIQDALSVQNDFEEAVRTQQLLNGEYEGYEDSYIELMNILALVSANIEAQGNLPSVVEVSYPDTQVDLVLAHDLYGDAERGAEIVERNSVRNPLFLPTELEILSF